MAQTNNEARADLFEIKLTELIGDADAFAISNPEWHRVRVLLLEARLHVRAMKSTDAMGGNHDQVKATRYPRRHLSGK